MTSKNFPQDYTLKSNPVDNDLLIIADSEDSNAMKKITIGSMTADIGDGLIVDGSSSSTTTYSSDKINTLNGTQDTALTTGLALKVSKAGDNMTGLFKEAQGANIASATTTDLSAATGNCVTITGTTTITGLGTVQAGTVMKLTFSGALILTHNATSLILPNATGNITTAAGDSGIFQSLGSGNWKCLAYQRADGTSLGGVSITPLTEDTAGDMDADFVFAYDNSAGANRKQKINVYRATHAEAVARTSTTKFVPPAYLPAHTNGVSTHDSSATGAETIAHGLGQTPKKITIKAIKATGVATLGSVSEGAYNGTTNSAIYFTTGESGTPDNWINGTSNTQIVYLDFKGTTNSAIATFDGTNITLTWSKTGSPTGTVYLLWEANT